MPRRSSGDSTTESSSAIVLACLFIILSHQAAVPLSKHRHRYPRDGRATGRRVRAETISQDAVRESLRSAGFGDKQIEGIAGMSAVNCEDFAAEDERSILTTTPTTLAAWAHASLARRTDISVIKGLLSQWGSVRDGHCRVTHIGAGELEVGRRVSLHDRTIVR
jgi:hypothetical protein